MSLTAYRPDGPITCIECGWRGYVAPVWWEDSDVTHRVGPCCSRACLQTRCDRTEEERQ